MSLSAEPHSNDPTPTLQHALTYIKREAATMEPAMQLARKAEAYPLCVDLDYTVLRTDTLFECLLDVFLQRPAALLKLPWWLAQGRAVLKQQLAASCDFDPATLPYRQELVDDLKAAREAGRTLVLATAADGSIAHKVAQHLGLFDFVLASNGRTNLSGESKRQALAATFGPGKFDYVGDNPDDLAVWKSAHRA